MTPFGEALRRLRRRKGVSQKQMAATLGVSPAYLSALEHGRRGVPNFELLQRIAGSFDVIWDDADELFGLAALSDPRVVLDTAGLDPDHTAFANRLAGSIRTLSIETVRNLDDVLANALLPARDL